MTDEEIEVNFSLDAEGRTALLSSQKSGSAAGLIDYTTRVIDTHFVADPEMDKDGTKTTITSLLYDELLLDCEIADIGLMPRTFWVPAAASDDDDEESFQPRCTLEQMARDIFRHHTASCYPHQHYDPSTSGAEWWVQLRPSPETTGRYSMLVHGSADDDEEERNGISFHWDKDEDLRLLCGGSVYVHPHLSTVTYLTGLGAPTLVAEDFRVHNLTGEWIPPSPIESKHDGGSSHGNNVALKASETAASAFISWPAAGKHLCFDGRFLHAAPFDIQEPGAFAKQCQVPTESAGDKVERRHHRRYTFLVNIWLNHRPFNVSPFPDTMIDKLSGYYHSANTLSKTCSQRMSLSLERDADDGNVSTRITTVAVHVDKTPSVHEIQGHSGDGKILDRSLKRFAWHMGDCDSGETIQAWLPLELIRSKANQGGNFRIHWLKTSSCKNNTGLFLVKEATNEGPDSKRLRR